MLLDFTIVLGKRNREWQLSFIAFHSCAGFATNELTAFYLFLCCILFSCRISFFGDYPLNLSSLSLSKLSSRALSLGTAAVLCTGLLTLASGTAEARRVRTHSRSSHSF